MSKSTEKPLMRRKINVSASQLAKWKSEYLFDIRNLINQSYLTEDDLGTTIEHQNREFQIIGMGESNHIMLKEIVNGESVYWECTRYFVQMKLERFNKEYKKLPGGKTTLIDIPYETSKLLLPPKGKKSKAKKEEADEIENESDLSDWNETEEIVQTEEFL